MPRDMLKHLDFATRFNTSGLLNPVYDKDNPQVGLQFVGRPPQGESIKPLPGYRTGDRGVASLVGTGDRGVAGDYTGAGQLYNDRFRTRTGTGNVDLYTDVKKALPMYQELFSDLLSSEEQGNRTKSNMMFNIAEAGLNFAAGVDASGKSVTDQPIVSQAAAAAKGLPTQIAAQADRTSA